MKISETLHEIKKQLSNKGDVGYEDYLDNVVGCVVEGVDYEYDAFVIEQLEIVLTQFWNNKNNLIETMEKIKDLISSHDGKKYKQKLGMVRYEFDSDKFHKNNKYMLYIIPIPFMLCVLRMLYIELYMGIKSTFSSWIIPFIIVIISTILLPYLFTYNAKKAKYKTNFIEIKDNICTYNKMQSAYVFTGVERRIYYIDKVLSAEANFKKLVIHGNIDVKKSIDGSNKVEYFTTESELIIPNYYKNMEEVISFISTKIENNKR